MKQRQVQAKNENISVNREDMILFFRTDTKTRGGGEQH
jgi:hypothetical protein